MNQQELRAKINEGIDLIAKEMGPKPADPNDRTPPAVKAAMEAESEKIAAFVVVGLSLLGELLMDIKRIADAAETSTYDKIDPALNV